MDGLSQCFSTPAVSEYRELITPDPSLAPFIHEPFAEYRKETWSKELAKTLRAKNLALTQNWPAFVDTYRTLLADPPTDTDSGRDTVRSLRPLPLTRSRFAASVYAAAFPRTLIDGDGRLTPRGCGHHRSVV